MQIEKRNENLPSPAQKKGHRKKMDALKEFSLPIQGMKIGVREFDFYLDRTFFSHFKDSPIAESDLDVRLTFEKRSDLMILDFRILGTVRTNCDRCLAEIDLPVEIDQQLLVKYGDDEGVPNDELIFISEFEHQLNVAPFVYEFAVLALPIVKTYECDEEPEPPCDFEMLEKISPSDGSGDKPNQAWDILRGFQDN